MRVCVCVVCSLTRDVELTVPTARGVTDVCFNLNLRQSFGWRETRTTTADAIRIIHGHKSKSHTPTHTPTQPRRTRARTHMHYRGDILDLN